MMIKVDDSYCRHIPLCLRRQRKDVTCYVVISETLKKSQNSKDEKCRILDTEKEEELENITKNDPNE